MSRIVESMIIPREDLLLFAYAQHMAKTARSDTAKIMFETYLRLEGQRLEKDVAGRKQVAKSETREEQR